MQGVELIKLTFTAAAAAAVTEVGAARPADGADRARSAGASALEVHGAGRARWGDGWRPAD